MVGMIFVCKIIHLATKIFGSTNFNHIPAEFVISYKSIVGTLEASKKYKREKKKGTSEKKKKRYKREKKRVLKGKKKRVLKGRKKGPQGKKKGSSLHPKKKVPSSVRVFTIALLLKPLSRHRMHDHG